MKLTSAFVLITLIGICTGLNSAGIYAQENPITMHPKVSLLDDNGKTVIDATGKISFFRTCGQCHDTQYINNHNIHFNKNVQADCMVCHFKEGRMAGDYTQAHLRIQMPANENCALCHGLVQLCDDPLLIPEDYTRNLTYRAGEKFYDLTQHTGEILAPQDILLSSLNLKDKSKLHQPWDVHARRQLKCIACHFIANDPSYCGNIQPALGHLLRDPRKVKSPGEILKRPDHNLKVSKCTCCHDPYKIHPNLPYKKRHLDVLACQSCHVPEIYGPAFQTIDQTVVTADGGSRIEFRGEDESQSHGSAVSTKYLTGYQPLLFPHKIAANTYKISPFNLVTQWFWKSQKTGLPVTADILKKVYFTDPVAGESTLLYAADVLHVFDKNNNHTLDTSELRLDTPEKIALIKTKLTASGIVAPVITGTIKTYKVNHGVVEALHMKRDCSFCHANNSKLGRDFLLASFAPAGILPQFAPDTLPQINGTVTVTKDNRLMLVRTASVSHHYILGLGRIQWLDTIAFWIFILALLGVCGHALARYVSSLKHPTHRPKTEKVYMYRFYERLWHWTMVTGIFLLALTGLEIHYAGSFTLFGLAYAVSMHNVLAAILVINAALSLFYHLTTGEIKQFFSFNRKFIHEVLVQIYYYIKGIFIGVPHPIAKTVERKLNPLQQLTYIVLLNILLPFQILTGVLMWGVEKWPFVSQQLGGLTYLGPIHNFGAWLFLTFIVVHVYLTTTGHTVLSNIRAMITGYDDVAANEPHEEHQRLMDKKLLDLMGTLFYKITTQEKPHPSVEEKK